MNGDASLALEAMSIWTACVWQALLSVTRAIREVRVAPAARPWTSSGPETFVESFS